ncbi:hypothetical protein QUA32_12395 [Microcoleus sp. Pol14D6]|uniref:hypothetical protein n=1 Tax=unclassified Microcoleus TaxID=2642155 RepID=UPI002FCED85D
MGDNSPTPTKNLGNNQGFLRKTRFLILRISRKSRSPASHFPPIAPHPRPELPLIS